AARPEIICFAEPRCGIASGPGPWVGPMHGFITKFADGVFYPEEIEILTAAFDDAWARVQASRTPFSREDDAELMAKEHVLGFKPARRLEEVDDEHCERMQQRDHRPRSCAHQVERPMTLRTSAVAVSFPKITSGRNGGAARTRLGSRGAPRRSDVRH